MLDYGVCETNSKVRLVHSAEVSQNEKRAAYAILEEWWPNSTRNRRLVGIAEEKNEGKGLKESWALFLLDREEVVGFCRLGKCRDQHAHGCALTYVIVGKERRGKGLGKILMREAEAVALSLGFQYVYLWTQISEFYAKLGYVNCERVAMATPSLRKLSASGLASLEGLFARKLRVYGRKEGGGVAMTLATTAEAGHAGGGRGRRGGGGGGGGGGAAATAADDTASTDKEAPATVPANVWMRKRISSTLFNFHVIQDRQAGKVIQNAVSAKGEDFVAFARRVEVALQVGPCCGICALASARKYLIRGSKVDGEEMLSFVRTNRLSQDGELFDLKDFRVLCEAYGVVARVVDDFTSLGAGEIFSLLLNNQLVVVPFDCERGEPCIRDGYKSHFGLVAGIVFRSTRSTKERALSPEFVWAIGDGDPFSFAPTGKVTRESLSLDFDCDLEESSACVYVVHSSSKTPRVWSLAELKESNRQLRCSRFPGVENLLGNKAIVLSSRSSSVIST